MYIHISKQYKASINKFQVLVNVGKKKFALGYVFQHPQAMFVYVPTTSTSPAV